MVEPIAEEDKKSEQEEENKGQPTSEQPAPMSAVDEIDAKLEEFKRKYDAAMQEMLENFFAGVQAPDDGPYEFENQPV